MRIEYEYDGKGKSQSCELNIVVDNYDSSGWSSMFDKPEFTATVYGYDFKETFKLLIGNLFCMKKVLEDTIEDVFNNNISIVNKHNNEILEEETIVDYFTGERTYRPIKPLIKEVIDSINNEPKKSDTKYSCINVPSNELNCDINGINTDEIFVPREYLCKLCNINESHSDVELMYNLKDSTITMLYYPITNIDCIKEFHNIGISPNDKIYIHPDTYKRIGLDKYDILVLSLSGGKQ